MQIKIANQWTISLEVLELFVKKAFIILEIVLFVCVCVCLCLCVCERHNVQCPGLLFWGYVHIASLVDPHRPLVTQNKKRTMKEKGKQPGLQLLL